MPKHSTQSTGALIAFALVLGIAAGCAGTSQPDPREDIEAAIRDFHGLIMWGMYEEAAGYLPVGQRNSFIGHYEAIGDDIEFTEFDVGTFDVDPLEETVRVHVTLSWYRVPYYVIEETRIRETWRMDPETDHWVLAERVQPE